MTEIFNRRNQKSLRRELRKRPTVAERLLWAQLRGSRMGIKFRRQYGVGPFIVDFCAPGARLVIELDGDSHFHDSMKEHDHLRQQEIKALGLRVLRFTDDQVRESLEDVIGIIQEKVESLRPPPAPPSEGGGSE